jgi:hypothetical protein
MPKYGFYQNAAPYFDLVRGALGDLVDGKHFFDIITDEIIYEVLYDFPGWPRVIRGRTDLMAAFKGYVDNITLQSADELVVHTTNRFWQLLRLFAAAHEPLHGPFRPMIMSASMAAMEGQAAMASTLSEGRS